MHGGKHNDHGSIIAVARKGVNGRALARDEISLAWRSRRQAGLDRLNCERRRNQEIMTKAKSLRFMATIYKIWMMRHVDVPEEIVRALQKQMTNGAGRGTTRKAAGKVQGPKPVRYIPVVATVSGKSAQTTLVPAGGGHFRMQINTALRKAGAVDAGDVASIELRLDRSSRERPVPADLQAGLKQHPKAARAFEELPAGHRRELVQWFDAAKSAKARKRRLERAIDHLLERALLGPGRGKSKGD